MEVEFGVVSNADGSAIYSNGNTTVLASVVGPVAVRGRAEQIDRATIDISVETFSEAPSLNHVAQAETLKQLVKTVVFDCLHPRTNISITVQPLQVDGSFLAVAFNATMAALLDAGIPMLRTAFAGCCVYGPATDMTDAAEPGLIANPTAAAEASSASRHFAAYDPKSLATALHMQHEGRMTIARVEEASQHLSQTAIKGTAEFISAAYRQRTRTALPAQ